MGRCCMFMNVIDDVSLASGTATERVVDDVTELEAIDGVAAERRESQCHVSTAYWQCRPGTYVKQRDTGLTDAARSTRRGRVAWASLPSTRNDDDQRHAEQPTSLHDNGIYYTCM